MSQIAETLTKQIATAEALLQRVAAIPDGMPSPHLAGFIRYDDKYTRPLTSEADGWETETREILRVLYGEESHQVADFLDCTRNKNHYFKFREELHDELESCIAFLKALIKAEDMKLQLAVDQPKNNNSKTPMVFISHSSKDKDFAEALVVLLEDLGMDSRNVFCSSVEGYGVGLSQDIFETLRSLFNNHELFVIFIHSPRYYDSAVSLNEMGAAWGLKTGFCSFLTTDMEFSDMKGVINQSKLSLKVDSEQAPAQLTELKNILIQTFGLSNLDETKWERKRKQFLDKVCSIKYEAIPESGRSFSEASNEAIIRAYSVKERSGQRALYIKNEGDSKATNLVINLPNEEECWSSRPSFPVKYEELLPRAQRVITLALIEGQNEATLHYTWDDEFQQGNEETQTIDL